MTQKEKLLDLINDFGDDIAFCDICDRPTDDCKACKNEQLADHLLANGVIVPPCKVGDVVYYLDDIVWDSECCDCEHYLVGGFGDPSECGRTKDGNKHPDCIEIIEHVITQRDILRYLYYAQFGKTVFLTREEAEKALKERERE